MSESASRSCRATPYPKMLRQINQILYYNRKIDKPKNQEIVRQCLINRHVLKLTERELMKITQLFELMKTDPYYDSVDKVLEFTQESYIKRTMPELLECSHLSRTEADDDCGLQSSTFSLSENEAGSPEGSEDIPEHKSDE